MLVYSVGLIDNYLLMHFIQIFDLCSYEISNETEWLNFVSDNLNKGLTTNLSWSAFHADKERAAKKLPCITSLLPLFKEDPRSLSMVRHGMDLVRRSTEFLNPGQTPVMDVDQPLYAAGKQIQWMYPDEYGGDKFLLVFAGVHTEKAALSVIGDLL